MIIRSRRYDIARQDPVLRHRSQRDSWNSCNSILFRDSILELWQKQALHYIVMANCKAALQLLRILWTLRTCSKPGVDPYSRNFPKVKREYDYRGRAIPSFEDTIRSDSSIGAWTHEGNTRERKRVDILDFSNLLWMNCSPSFLLQPIILYLYLVYDLWKDYSFQK